MVTSKQDIISAYQESTRRLEGILSGRSEDDLKRDANEGWTAKQVVCHLASTAGSAAFFIAMAQSGQSAAGGFDVDTWNAEQVAARQDRPLEEIVAEFRTGHEGSIKAVEEVADELLVKQVPDFSGGMSALADLIREAATEHEAEHLADLEKVLSS